VSATGWVLLVALVVVAVLIVLYLSMTAGRLDRLHKRIDTAQSTLDLLLARRSAAVLDVAGSGLVDPAAAAVLVDSAHTALAEGESGSSGAGLGASAGRRWLAESDLSKALREVFDDPHDLPDAQDAPEEYALVDALAGICQRVELARRFHNDGVRACRAVRKLRLVRWLRLAGRTAWPQTVEMDDTPPEGFSLLMP
jgi:hypothetical protein